jgi:hypothetical protein
MKLATLSPSDRRALMLGAFVVVPSLLYVFGVKPYRAALSDIQQQLIVEREAFAKERAAVAAAQRNPQLRHVADSAMTATAPRLFVGRDDVIASGEVASYLGDVARASHVWLQDASTRPATSLDGGVRALHVELRGESDLRGILGFLRALETGSKLIRVQRLDISVQPGRSDQPGAETLALSASIVGYAIPDASAPAGAPGPPAAQAAQAAQAAPKEAP